MHKMGVQLSGKLNFREPLISRSTLGRRKEESIGGCGKSSFFQAQDQEDGDGRPGMA